MGSGFTLAKGIGTTLKPFTKVWIRQWVTIIGLSSVATLAAATGVVSYSDRNEKSTKNQAPAETQRATEANDEASRPAGSKAATPAHSDSCSSLKHQGSVAILAPSGGCGANGLKSSKVREVILKHNPAIQECYRQMLKAFPELKGMVTVLFAVDAKGRLHEPEILKSSMASPQLEKEILEKMKQWNDFGACEKRSAPAKYRVSYKFGS